MLARERATPQRQQNTSRDAAHGRSPTQAADVIGALQRQIGNRATGRFLSRLSGARRQAEPPTTIQRRPWLNNADQRSYRDPDVAEDLTFVGNSGGNKNIGVFIPYANLSALNTWVTALQKERVATFGARVLDTLPQAVANSATWRAQLTAAIGTLYFEDQQRDLQISAKQLDMPTVKLLFDAALAGPLLRREGGGSRLPQAAGKLYIDKTIYPSKDAVLLSLGIKPEDLGSYRRVEEVLCDSSSDMDARQYRDWDGQSERISESGYIYVSSVVARPSGNRLVTAAGKNYQLDFSDAADMNALDLSFTGLALPVTTGWEQHLSGGRDDTDQVSVMGKWNALGAVAFHNAHRSNQGGPINTNQNFEWLHIRGAQIGGHTVQGNMVAGSFSANSAMIPYESLIKRWHQGNDGKIFARFSAQLLDRVIAKQIKIEIYTFQHPLLGSTDQSTPLELTFDPLTGAVVDKLTGKIQAKRFEDARKRQTNQPPLNVLLNPSVPPSLPPFVTPADLVPRNQAAQAPPQTNAPNNALMGFQPYFAQYQGDIVLTTTPQASTLEFSVPAQSMLNLLSSPGGLEGLATMLDAVDDRARLFGGTLEVEGGGFSFVFGRGGLDVRPSSVVRRVARMAPRRLEGASDVGSQLVPLTGGKRVREENPNTRSEDERARWTFRLKLTHEFTGAPPQLGQPGLGLPMNFGMPLNFGIPMPFPLAPNLAPQQVPLLQNVGPQQQSEATDMEQSEQ